MALALPVLINGCSSDASNPLCCTEFKVGATIDASIGGSAQSQVVIDQNTIKSAAGKILEAAAGEKLKIPLAQVRRSEFSGAVMQLRTMGAGFERAAGFDVPLTADSSEAVLDLAALKPAPGDYLIAFYGSAVAKYRYNPEAIAVAEAARQQAEQELKAAEAEAKAAIEAANAAAPDKKAEADKFASDWQKDNPKDAAMPFYLGDRATAASDFALAEKSYQQALKLQPNNPVLYNNLAWIIGRLGKEGALAFAEKANSLSPNQPAFMDTWAMLLSEKGEAARALELQKKVVALQPDAAMFKLNLAKIQIKAGDKTAAKATLDEIARLGSKYGGQAEVEKLLKQL